MAVPNEWCVRLTKWKIHEMRLKLNVVGTIFFFCAQSTKILRSYSIKRSDLTIEEMITLD